MRDGSLLVRRHRRVIAAALVAVALAAGISAIEPRPMPTTQVVTAAHDLAGGQVLQPTDLVTAGIPPADVPAGVITSIAAAVGRQLSGPLRSGEQLTDVRLDNGPLTPPGPGLVATPVRLADVEATEILEPGQRVDILAASTAVDPASSPAAGPGAPTGAADVVAADVRVVALPVTPTAAAVSTDDVGVEGALVVLATTPYQAQLLAQAQVTGRLSAVVVG